SRRSERILGRSAGSGQHRLHERGLQGDAEWTIETAAGGRREVGEELAAVVVQPEPGPDDDFGRNAVSQADTRAESRLRVGEGGVRGAWSCELLVVSGDDETAVDNGVGGQ